MRWEGGRRSDNIEDRRGERWGGGVGRGLAGGGLGLVLIVVVAMFLGVDPSVLLQGGLPGEPAPAPSTSAPPSTSGTAPAKDPQRDFVAVVLADTEDVWGEIFRRSGTTYREPKLVLFSGAVDSACGMAQAAVGPFYCPPDERVYLDLGFFRDLHERFRAPGDFAQAYVIAHEVGHHVQNLLGLADRVRNLQSRLPEREANRLSVRMELQADCLAGVWAHHAQRTRQILEAGDVEEALGAAAAVGDDRIQMRTRGYVAPDGFTHGSAEQRVQWFRRGLASGDVGQCDTFGGRGGGL